MPVDPRWYEWFFETRAGFGERRVFGGHGDGALTMDEFRVQIVARKRKSSGPVRMA